MIEVMVVDDHEIFRRGLHTILDEVGDMRVACEAASADEAVASLRDCTCQVVLLDIGLPNGSGIDVLEHIRAHCPEKQVLVLSVYPEDQYALRLLKMGAAGYMNKEIAPRQLVDAIRRIAAGRKYISPTLAEALAERELNGSGDKRPHDTLSNREFQVFCRLARGETVSEIALDMHLSIKTVSTYRSRVLEKLHLRNEAEITAYALRNGVIA